MVVIAEIDVLARHRVDVAEQLRRVAAHHGLGQRMLYLSALDLRRLSRRFEGPLLERAMLVCNHSPYKESRLSSNDRVWPFRG